MISMIAQKISCTSVRLVCDFKDVGILKPEANMGDSCLQIITSLCDHTVGTSSRISYIHAWFLMPFIEISPTTGPRMVTSKGKYSSDPVGNTEDTRVPSMQPTRETKPSTRIDGGWRCCMTGASPDSYRNRD